METVAGEDAARPALRSWVVPKVSDENLHN
jgi:hypothetical protein